MPHKRKKPDVDAGCDLVILRRPYTPQGKMTTPWDLQVGEAFLPLGTFLKAIIYLTQQLVVWQDEPLHHPGVCCEEIPTGLFP